MLAFRALRHAGRLQDWPKGTRSEEPVKVFRTWEEIKGKLHLRAPGTEAYRCGLESCKGRKVFCEGFSGIDMCPRCRNYEMFDVAFFRALQRDGGLARAMGTSPGDLECAERYHFLNPAPRVRLWRREPRDES